MHLIHKEAILVREQIKQCSLINSIEDNSFFDIMYLRDFYRFIMETV